MNIEELHDQITEARKLEFTFRVAEGLVKKISALYKQLGYEYDPTNERIYKLED